MNPSNHSHPSSDSTTWTWLIALLLVVLVFITLTLCASVAIVGYWLKTHETSYRHPRVRIVYVTATPTPAPAPAWEPTPTPSIRPTPIPPTPTSRPSPVVTPVPPLPVNERGKVTVNEYKRVPLPTRDLRVLGMRFHPELGNIPPTVNATPPVYHVGDVRTFYATNTDENTHFQLKAKLRYMTEHAYYWVEIGQDVDQDELEKSARFFEEHIYPTDRRVFGEEWEPGVDNDPHITFLLASNLGSNLAGYFSSADSYPRLVSPYSNEMDMFYINLDATEPGDLFFDQVVAHEFQHMIQWHEDRNEDTWLNEGFSVLAEVLNDFPMGGHVYVYLSDPDLQLTGWSEDDATPHYGASGLFTYYFYQRFGEEAVRKLARDPENGMMSIDRVLQDMGFQRGARGVFADWIVANLINDPSIDPAYGYKEEIDDHASWTHDITEFPALWTDTVAQYGVDYIHLEGDGPVTVRFRGDVVNRLAPLRPHSGNFVMWGNRGDDSDSRLYTEVDLTHATTAKLTFWTWYDIEELWDFAYLIVSTDGGEHWSFLETPSMTRENPFGNNLGVGYTGKSGGGAVPQWVKEEVDLTPYVGQKILLGFEYVTDDALTRPGFFVDDVRIEGTTIDEDFESSPTGWVQEGFIRTDTYVPQTYLIQVIQKDHDKLYLERYFIEQSATYEFTIEDVGRGDTTVAVSAMAPLTWEPAEYTLSIDKP